MKNRATRLLSIFVILGVIEAPAMAYLDGATSSIILQAAVGLFATALVYFRLFKERALAFFGRVSGKTAVPRDAD